MIAKYVSDVVDGYITAYVKQFGRTPETIRVSYNDYMQLIHEYNSAFGCDGIIDNISSWNNVKITVIVGDTDDYKELKPKDLSIKERQFYIRNRKRKNNDRG